MLTYTLPRPTFDLLSQALGKQGAEQIANNFEQTVNDQRAELQQQLDTAQKVQKTTIKDELRNELITREVFEERFKVLDERFKVLDERFKSLDTRVEERFKRLDLKLNIFFALAFVSLTFANPTFTELVKHALK